MNSIIPFLPLLLGALAAILLRGWLRNILMLAAPIAGALNLVGIEHGCVLVYGVHGIRT